MEYKIVIPVEPRTKKNSQNIIFNKKLGRAMVIQNEKYTKFEKDCKPYIPHFDEPINYPVNVKCVYYRGTRRRVDLSNLISATMDILVKYKVLADDNRDIAAANDGSRVYYDKESPKTIITITPLDEKYEVWKEEK